MCTETFVQFFAKILHPINHDIHTQAHVKSSENQFTHQHSKLGKHLVTKKRIGLDASLNESETVRHINEHRNMQSAFSNIFDHDMEDSDDEFGVMRNDDDHSNHPDNPWDDTLLFFVSAWVLQYAVVLFFINPLFSVVILAAWLFVVLVESQIGNWTRYPTHRPTKQPSPNPTPLLRITLIPTITPTNTPTKIPTNTPTSMPSAEPSLSVMPSPS